MVQPIPEIYCELFFAHYPSVRRKLIAIIRDEAAAEDLAQETFLRLYRNPPEELEAVGAWLHRVLTRLAYDYLHQKSREREVLEKHERRAMADEVNALSGEEVMMRRLNQEEVQSWLEDLPERARQVLLMRYSGYNYAEIAEKLNVRRPLVGSLVHRATVRLKRRALPSGVGGAETELREERQ
ncbi:sigma-70 family RNA polymerase sigma factor [Paenibacillus sp. y28]|uniref:sigma-70 family RNA polymerase sigma factor n=1 Tax=Paenibacillus sp. y28 TaxID=3129110 RepID=UPI003017D8D4